MENTSSPSPANLYAMLPADQAKHLLPIAKLISDVFAGGQYVEEICQTYIGNCHYDWDTTRLIWDGNKLVHHWGVWGYRMRLGSTLLNVAGIGAVATDEAYRKQGLMHQAALASFKAMQENGYDLTILRGRHYVKFGYVRAWNYVTYKLKPEELPALAPKTPYRKLGQEFIPDMDSLYNCNYASFSGTAVRPTYRNKNLEELGVYGWFVAGGKLSGYVCAAPAEDNPRLLNCLEAVGDPQQGLAILGELFKKGGYEQLHFFTLPHRHPILQILRRAAVIVEDRYFDSSGWRVRIIDLHRILDKIRPQLEARLKGSNFADWSGTLHLDAGEQKSTLVIQAGRIQVTGEAGGEHCLHAGPALARFLIGSDEPEEIIQQEEIQYTGSACRLVEVLFPNLHPMMSFWDEY